MTTWHTEQHCVSVLWKREVVHLLTTAAIFNLRLNLGKKLCKSFPYSRPITTEHRFVQHSNQINKIFPVWRKAANFLCSLPTRPDVQGRLWCHFLAPHTLHSHSWALSGNPLQPDFPWRIFQQQNFETYNGTQRYEEAGWNTEELLKGRSWTLNHITINCFI